MFYRKLSIFKFVLFVLFMLLNAFQFQAQFKNLGLPYLINYTPEQYGAHKQNWSVIEDQRGIVYFGNSMGILEFDGQNWRLISLPNNSIVRSLAINEQGKIFVGSRGDFGYLATNSLGTMQYFSLLDKIGPDELKKFGDIGRIFIIDGKVFFTCEEYVFEYLQDQIKAYKIPNLKQVYEFNNQIFVRLDGKNGGLGKYSDGKITMIPGTDEFKDWSVRAVLPYGENLLIVTMANGLFVYKNNGVEKLETSNDKFFEQEKIISAIALRDGNYAFGLFSSGLLVIDKYGEVIQHLHTGNGLQNGQIPNLMQDSNDNLWLTTGNGISYILSSLPFSIYSNIYSLNSTVYAAFKYSGFLYAATSTGLFYRKWEDKEKHLNQVEIFNDLGEPMNIWSLDTINGVFLAATNLGISVINEKKISEIKINERIQVWKFLRIHGNSNQILAGTNKGFLLLEFKGANKKTSTRAKLKEPQKPKGQWVFKSKVKGFAERCRHVEIDKNNNIWFSDKAKGVAKLKPVNDFDSVSVIWYNEDKGLPAEGERYVFQIKGEIIVSAESGIYVYNEKEDDFKLDPNWNKLIAKGHALTLMSVDKEGNIWFKQQRKNKQTEELIFELGKLSLQKNGTYDLDMTPFYKLKNNIHSIYHLDKGKLIIGTDKGFIHYDPDVKKAFHKPYNALIRKVELISNDSLIFDGAFSDTTGIAGLKQPVEQLVKIPYRYHNLRFTFSAPFFDSPEQIQFKYYLEYNDEEWSDWKTKNFKEYSNLREGNYKFRVVAKNIYEIESIEAVYEFTILPPWYRTIWAYILYGIGIVLIIWLIVRLSVRRLRKQKEYLEKVVEERTAEIRMKNVELEQQKEEIMAQRDEIELQKDKIEEKNKNITASITYAKRIQDAMLPLKEKIDQAFDDYFILFKPRDIVSGDFYWFNTRNNKIILTAVDCTGHGVPGAFMSMIGSEILTTIVNQGITVPSEILDYMNRYVRKALKQDQTENQDGMDMSLCTIDKQAKIVEWAGAKNPMIYIQNNELFHLKGDTQSIGGHQLSKKERQFSNHVVSYAQGPTYFYIFTDGYQDQFGGGKARKFMVKSMKEMFFEHYSEPMNLQHKIYDAVIEEWKKNAEQTDDILVIGFKLSP